MMKITTLIARILFSIIFIVTGLFNFSAGSAGYAASRGIPLANVLVPLSAVTAIAGAISIILGYKIKIGALLIVLFLVPVSFIFHSFWNTTDPMQQQMDMVEFMKNMSIVGGALFFFVQGAGDLSLDARK